MGLDIRGKRNVYEALNFSVQGDTLDGDNQFMCESCNKKVDAQKRVCIGLLPNTLILNLKRFEFDFDTMRKVKVLYIFTPIMFLNIYKGI